MVSLKKKIRKIMRILQSNEQNTTEQFGKSGLLSSEKLTIIYIEQIDVDEVS